MQKYSNEIKGHALALEADGLSTRRTVERLKRLFPGEDIPAHNSIAEWRRRRHESLQEELEDNELVIARRADELVMQKLDWSEGHMDKARLAELVMAAGVYRDKPMKRATLNTVTVHAQNIQINFIPQANPGDIAEGEVVEE